VLIVIILDISPFVLDILSSSVAYRSYRTIEGVTP